MTAAIHHFPAPAAFTEALIGQACRTAIVTAARAVLRSACDHSDETLQEACVALQTWGNGTDYLEADVMLQAMAQRVRRRAHAEAKAQAKRGTIRAALVDIAGLLMLVALATAVYYMGVK